MENVSTSSVKINFWIFHEHTKLAILALLSTSYSNIFAISFFILHQMVLINVPLDVSG